MTKTRPILFSDPMVRAILDGRKTMTRRVVDMDRVLTANQKRIGFEQYTDLSKVHVDYPVKGCPRVVVKTRHPKDKHIEWSDCGGNAMYCPYGEIGDRLWVREAWQHFFNNRGEPIAEEWQQSPVHCFYRADESDQNTLPISGKWRPSILMPRWASRITLEITGVRAERLQDITDADAVAEGAVPSTWQDGTWYDGKAAGMFGELWDKINSKKYPWESNPWVWVVAFKAVQS